MFAYQTAAYRRGKDIDSLVTFGSPVDTTAPLPIPIAPGRRRPAGRRARRERAAAQGRAAELGGRASASRCSSPAKSVQGRVQFLLALNDRDALLPRERQRRFLDSEGWTAYSGPAIAELLEQFVTHNRMLEGGFVIDDRLVTLADIDVPVLTFVGATDTIGHPDAVRAIRRAAPQADVYEVTLPGGHFGLVVGSTRHRITWPTVADWIAWRSGQAELPDDDRAGRPGRARASRCGPAPRPPRWPRPPSSASAVGRARAASDAAGRRSWPAAWSARRRPSCRGWPASSSSTRPPASRSACCSTSRPAARPNDIAFLFGDRAHRQHDVKVPRRQRRQGPGQHRRAARRPGRRADGHPAQRVHPRRRAEPARRDGGAAAPRRRRRPRGRRWAASPG